MPAGKKQGKIFDRDLIRYGNLGLEMLVSVLIGVGGGYLLDRYLHTRPWLMILGFILGAAAGFRNLIRLMGQEKNKKD
jgi:ATP synthase protein I